MTIWHKRIACWIPKTKNTQAKYAIIIAIPLKQSLHGSNSALRYRHVVSLVDIYVGQLTVKCRLKHEYKDGILFYMQHVLQLTRKHHKYIIVTNFKVKSLMSLLISVRLLTAWSRVVL